MSGIHSGVRPFVTQQAVDVGVVGGLSGMTFFFYYQLFAVMAFIQGLSRAFVTSRDSHFLAAIPSKERDFAEKLMHRFLHLTRARKNVLWIAPLDLRHGVHDQLLKHGQLNV